MEPTQAPTLDRAAKALRMSLLVLINRVEDICDLIESAPSQQPIPEPPAVLIEGRELSTDRRSYVVRWGDRQCVLGHTLAFEVLERLARRPNEYISTESLLDELWIGHRTPSTVRSTVSRLRSRLRSSGLGPVGSRIDGSVRGHYGLMLTRP